MKSFWLNLALILLLSIGAVWYVMKRGRAFDTDACMRPFVQMQEQKVLVVMLMQDNTGATRQYVMSPLELASHACAF